MRDRRYLCAGICALLIMIAGSVLIYRSTGKDAALPAQPRTNAPSYEEDQTEVSPSPEAAPTQETSQPVNYTGLFELPLQGATGYATIDLNLRAQASASSEKTGSLPAGEGFRIIREEGDYWYITDGEKRGYVAHRYCMINLPDVIPSIVYDNTNAYDSRILSSGKAVPGITGAALYENKAYNQRLEMEEFIMPVLYSMAPKIMAAQKAALADGNSLKIYEAYRPYQVQRKVVDALDSLAQKDSTVRAGISTPPWKVSWFVSQGISQHQRGCAIDVSLVKVDQIRTKTCGNYLYDNVTSYTEYTMPTPIHELSSAAAVFSQPVQSLSQTAWRSATPARSINRAAMLLQKYCTDAGLTPLASEWWHFNDLEGYENIKNNAGEGKFVLEEVFSEAPED